MLQAVFSRAAFVALSFFSVLFLFPTSVPGQVARVKVTGGALFRLAPLPAQLLARSGDIEIRTLTPVQRLGIARPPRGDGGGASVGNLFLSQSLYSDPDDGNVVVLLWDEVTPNPTGVEVFFGEVSLGLIAGGLGPEGIGITEVPPGLQRFQIVSLDDGSTAVADQLVLEEQPFADATGLSCSTLGPDVDQPGTCVIAIDWTSPGDIEVVAQSYVLSIDNRSFAPVDAAEITRLEIDAVPPGDHVISLRGSSQTPAGNYLGLAVTTECRVACGGGEPRFTRSDCNDDGGLDISDAIFGLNFLFLGGRTPICAAACDANSDRGFDISDTIFELNFLFLGGAPPMPPFPACGQAADPDEECLESSVACPPVLTCPPREISGLDDIAQGTWTDATPENAADLDGDRDVDDDDLNLLLSRLDFPPGEDENGFFVPDPADFDANGIIDERDLGFLEGQYTGPLEATDFSIAGTALSSGERGAPLQYRIDTVGLVLDGVLIDSALPDVQWQFTGFGANNAHHARDTLGEPAALGSPEIAARGEELGLTPEQTALLQDFDAGILVTDIVDGFVDFSQETTGQVEVVCDGEQRTVDPANLSAFGLRYVSFLTTDGVRNECLTFLTSWLCPACVVFIQNCPVCVCKGCKYTFEALAFWVGGTYEWEVVEGADKTNPDSGTGSTFTTEFTGKSGAKKDIKIKVTYTTPDGKKCSATCSTTTVKLGVTFDTPPALVTPTADGAATNPDISGGRLRLGGSKPGVVVGVKGKVSKVKITTDPTCVDCCKKIKVGFIQNVLAQTELFTYEGGRTMRIDLDPAPPILDAVTGQSPPWYPYPAGKSMVCGKVCGVEFPLEIVDTPGFAVPLCQSGKKLTKSERKVTFRTFLVAECPKGSRSFKSFHQWDWKIDYDVDVTVTGCGPPATGTRVVNSAHATNTHNGAVKAAQWTAAKKGGAVANDSVKVTLTGF